MSVQPLRSYHGSLPAREQIQYVATFHMLASLPAMVKHFFVVAPGILERIGQDWHSVKREHILILQVCASPSDRSRHPMRLKWSIRGIHCSDDDFAWSPSPILLRVSGSSL